MLGDREDHITHILLHAGSYVLQLIVNDGVVDSAAGTVSVTSNAEETSGGGGGCTITPETGTPDPLLPALVLLALTGLGVRNKQ